MTVETVSVTLPTPEKLPENILTRSTAAGSHRSRLFLSVFLKILHPRRNGSSAFLRRSSPPSPLPSLASCSYSKIYLALLQNNSQFPESYEDCMEAPAFHFQEAASLHKFEEAGKPPRELIISRPADPG